MVAGCVILSVYMDLHVLSSHILGVSLKSAYLLMFAECNSCKIKAYIFNFLIN